MLWNEFTYAAPNILRKFRRKKLLFENNSVPVQKIRQTVNKHDVSWSQFPVFVGFFKHI